jgi:hypothetical protein
MRVSCRVGHYVWWCDTMYDDVTLCMMMWHHVCMYARLLASWTQFERWLILEKRIHVCMYSFRANTYVCMDVCVSPGEWDAVWKVYDLGEAAWYDDVTLCMMMWHYVCMMMWHYVDDVQFERCTILEKLHDMMMWHYVWWCDTMYVWWCDTMYDDVQFERCTILEKLLAVICWDYVPETLKVLINNDTVVGLFWHCSRSLLKVLFNNDVGIITNC